uniref:Reactive oxygen species modulator 1 n=1 Tax=Strongyloides papillosus TaxID=174720 RepID=A0A0N5C389_STREA
MSGYPRRENLSDVAKKYKEAGSCGEEFKKMFLKSVKYGFVGGAAFGTYIAYRTQQRSIRGFSVAVLYTTLASTLTFGCLGIVIGTYNCFNLD